MSFPLMPVAGGPAIVSSLTLVGTNSTATNTITFPSGTVAGDLAILIDAPTFTNNDPITLQGGSSGFIRQNDFTTLVTEGYGASFASGAIVSARILTSSDIGYAVYGSATIFGNSITAYAKYLYVLRGDSSISRFSAAKNLASTTTTSNPASQTAVATGVVSPAIVLGVAAQAGTGGTNFVTTTPAFTNASGSATKLSVGLSTVNAGTSAYSQLVDMNDLGTNTLLTFWFDVS